jgi:hypothetical protein
VGDPVIVAALGNGTDAVDVAVAEAAASSDRDDRLRELIDQASTATTTECVNDFETARRIYSVTSVDGGGLIHTAGGSCG